jgi:dephospho-CoA kinase
MKKRKIIGVAGHPSSGKDTVAHYLEERGFKHLSGGDTIRQKMKEIGLPLDRSSMREFIKGERAKHGNHYPAGEMADSIVGDTVISGFRNTAEVEIFKTRFPEEFTLIVVDSPIEHRYELAKARGRVGDDISFERFKEEEEKERRASDGSHEVDKVIASADKTVKNHQGLEELFKQIDEILQL